MLIHCVINRGNNLKCKNIMGFGDRNAYILKIYPDILQKVWEQGRVQNYFTNEYSSRPKGYYKCSNKYRTYLSCFKKHTTWAMNIAVCCLWPLGQLADSKDCLGMLQYELTTSLRVFYF